jgi:amino acid transporter
MEVMSSGPTSPDPLRRWRWPALLAWAVAFSLWASALIGVTIAAVSTVSTWRDVVQGYERDAQTVLYDEMYPDIPPRPLRSAEDAAEGVASANREYRDDLAIRGAILAVLLAVAFVYRRAFPPSARPTKRVWLFVVPLMLSIAVAVLLAFAAALGGAIRG